MLLELYQENDSPEFKGSDIVIPDHSSDALYISQTGNVFWYMGMCSTDLDRVSLASWPYYLVGKHATQCSKSIKGFFRIKNGCVLLTQFVDQEHYNAAYYKQLKNYIVKLPVPNSCYFGIEKRVESSTSWSFEENEELTRDCFGLTYTELEYIIKIYAERLGISNAYGQYPRITRSLKQDNYCDITGLWIPKGFPYIAFNASPYDYAHVSIYGFYRHVGAFLSMGSNTTVRKIFEYKTFAENIISRLRSIGDYFPFEIKVTREVICPDFYV